ncbi:pentapeptide repeat-containing protein [Oscillatoria sp. CS-180]|uniref:pentapeptide repeat-containing protein n=1 Tax=Oscillatoria sp. CS-180 TaxID=3021720 RepID=UPI00232C8AB0|nr:pentapeptide repeat-containing protein [Oscillatoria sp. CS-180]MDB9529008.1 pentapeptide repeat-containing protein [Oscillatoria sp. CS-180]
MKLSSSSTAETLLQKYAEGERDFSGSVLNECALSGAQLSHIVLQRASLKVVNLSTANLSHSNLRGAILNVSRMSGVNLSQADLQRAQLNVTNLIRAVLIGANLTNASLIRAELLRADLSNADLTNANLQEADLREARLRWANLDSANLNHGNLRHSSLLGANLTNIQANSADLEHAKLNGASLMAAELRHANLQRADLSGANLRGVNLRWANLSGADLRDADLTDAKLSGADLTGAQLEGAILEGTILVHADLSRSNLRRVRCVGSDLSGATLTGAQMYGIIAYDVQTIDIVCDWIDLSPLADQTQHRYFNAGIDVHTFLNQRPPQVKIVVDTALTWEANTALAAFYERIAKGCAVFSCPPEIQLTNRRTELTFIAEDEMRLSAIAYLAVLPFQDGKAIHTTLLTLMSQGREQASQSFAWDEAHRELHRAIESLQRNGWDGEQLLLPDLPFFAASTYVKLGNASGRSLDLYRNPQFGTRNLQTTDGIFSLEASFVATPSWEDYWAFLSPIGSSLDSNGKVPKRDQPIERGAALAEKARGQESRKREEHYNKRPASERERH